jgi:dihydrofolate reductase
MRSIVAALIVSVDGVYEAPDKWAGSYFGREVTEAIVSSMSQSDALLLGRRTYDEFAAVWPSRGTDNAVGSYMNNSAKYVVSTGQPDLSWNNSTLIAGDVYSGVQALKQTAGRNINITGSPALVRSLIAVGLLDSLTLIVYPVIRGTGKRWFTKDLEDTRLELSDQRRLDGQVLWLTYRPTAAAA